MELCSLSTVRELLKKYSLAPQKGFGQNFLVDAAVPARIAGSAAAGRDCGRFGEAPCEDADVCALEIGPGLGTMTQWLSQLFSYTVAVEIDRGLMPLLDETLAECENVKVVNEDFLKLDIPQLLREQFGEKPVRVCANLPYYITTPIIMALLEAFPPSVTPQVQSVTVLVQSEVADRLCAEAGSAAYGSVTAAVALAGRAKKLFTVPAGSFFPAPKVSSAVVQITMYENGVRGEFPGLPENDEELDAFVAKTKALIAAAFAQRRKTLTNALSALAPKERVAAALEELGLRADIRGERLSAADFVRLNGLLNGG